MSMNDLKDSLLLLCNILNKIFNETILSDTFKNAKSDSTGPSVANLWTILHRFSCSTELVCPAENSVLCVKLYLAKLGYKGTCFYSLPSDKSYGSRELLLAFTWVISNWGIEKNLEKLLKERNHMNEFFPCSCDHSKTEELTAESGKNNYGRQGVAVPKLPCNSLDKELEKNISHLPFSDYFNYILLIAGKLKQLLLMNKVLICKRSQLVNKLHSETARAFGLPHLSVGESIAVVKENYMEKYVSDMEKTVELIDAYVLWVKSAKSFYVWMDTVIGEKGKKETALPSDNQLKSIKEFQLALENEYKLEEEKHTLHSSSDITRNVITSETLEDCDKEFDLITKEMLPLIEAFTID